MQHDLSSFSRVLLTGATGFVGGHVAASLVREGVALRLLVRPTSDLDRLRPGVRRALEAEDGSVELFEGDLTVPESLEGICEGVDALIHCACAVKGTFDESRRSREIFQRVNVEGTQNLARRAADTGLRMVHLSSTAAMGPVTDREVDETTECVPVAPYQVSKRQAELALLDLHEQQGLDVVILRPCLILGPGKDGGEPLQLFNLARWGLFPKIGGEMSQTKPLIDVRDVAQACTAALARDPPRRAWRARWRRGAAGPGLRRRGEWCAARARAPGAIRGRRAARSIPLSLRGA
jgi:nucleoside-diphosphate-sugar epimerase